MKHQGLVVEPLISNSFNHRSQVNLIDIQTCPDGPYKLIMHCQYHLSKFCALGPLKTKTALEVAEQLELVFGWLGAPRIFQPDNGKEFVNSVIRDFVSLWRGCVIVNGHPRHPQS